MPSSLTKFVESVENLRMGPSLSYLCLFGKQKSTNFGDTLSLQELAGAALLQLTHPKVRMWDQLPCSNQRLEAYTEPSDS